MVEVTRGRQEAEKELQNSRGGEGVGEQEEGSTKNGTETVQL
jgi:hypothetical protein